MRGTAFSRRLEKISSRSRSRFGWISLHTTIHRLIPLLLVVAVITPFVLHFRLRRFQQMRLSGCEWLQKPPLVCAHGGDPSNAFPNTMEAYYYALQLHVDCIEIDISRSSDGVLFAMHDRELQKITGNSSAKLGYLSRTEINELDARHQKPIKIKKQQVPTLEDALKLISEAVRVVILDAKIGPPLYEKGLAEDILSVVKKTNCRNCIIWSKSDSLVAKIIKLTQDVAVGYVVMNDPSGVRSKHLRMNMADVVGVYHPLIDEKLVKTLHWSKKKVYAWTVDDESSMHKVLRQNIDAIITGKPSVLQGLMEKIKIECGSPPFIPSVKERSSSGGVSFTT